MAKNKKPRKQYHKKPCRTIVFTEEDKAEISTLLDTAETTIRLGFRDGYATPYHLDNVRHIMNAAIVCMEDQNWHKDEDKSAVLDYIYESAEGMYRVIERHNSGKCQGFVFTGDELQHLADAYRICNSFIMECADTRPGTFFREWTASYILDDWQSVTKKPVTPEMVQRVVKRLADLPTIEWRKLHV